MKYVFILISIILLWYTSDLKQNNSEKIFLSDQSLERYFEYQKLAPNLDFLIVKVKDKDFSKIDQLSLLEDQFEDIELIKPPKFTTNSKLQTSFNFYGDQHFAFMALVSPNKDISPFIAEVERIYGEDKVSFLGNPYTNFKLDHYSDSIKELLFPLCFIISFILIFIFIRVFTISLNIFLPALFCALSTLALVKIYAAELNLVSSILPLMNFVICLSLMFHLYYTHENNRNIKENIKETIKETIIEKIIPILLMLSTTAIGFGSLYFSKIRAISDFGLLSIILIPFTGAFGLFWFRYCAFESKKHLKIEEITFLKKLIFKKTLSHKVLWSLNIVVLILGIFSFNKMKILTDATKYFPVSSGFREKSEDIAKTVSGIPLFDLLLFNKPDSETLHKLEESVKALNPDFKLVHIDRILEEANEVYSGSKSIPANSYALNLMKSQIGLPLVKFFENSKGYRLLITGLPLDVEPYQLYLEKIKSLYAFDHLDGLYYHLMTGQKDMMETLYYSFLGSVIVISILAAFYLKSIKVLIIFNLSNILPALIGIIFLNLLGFSLNIATIMTFSIALGLVVDGSFHLIHSLNNKKLSFTQFHQTTTLPIILSTLIFSMSFLLFALHPFLPIRQFGVSLSLICVFGLFYDLFILPTLYLGTNKLKEYFNEKI